MKFKKGSEITLEIDSLAYGGKGIGNIEGWKVFVADTCPGDKVLARLVKKKSSYGEAKLLEILEPSKKRIAARCKHFDTCGGCKWQFLPYEEQLVEKENQVRESVVRLGGLSGELVRGIIGCEEAWFYRNKMELSFENADGMVKIGFHPPRYHYEVFDLQECFLESELMAEIVGKVRDFANAHGLSVYDSHSHEGTLRNLVIREGKNTGEVMVNLVTSTGIFDYVEEFKALFAGNERISSVYWSTVYQVPGQPTWVEEQLLSGKESLLEALELEDGLRLEFDIAPSAFFQTNTKQAEVLYSKVVELAGLSGDELVFDLYCGTGTIGMFCAHKAKSVVGIEINEAAVENARSNAIKNGISNISFYLGSVEDRLSSLTEKPDVVIVDPPRAGLGEKVVEQCCEFGAGRLVYVSCNPTTMARDLKNFVEKGYRVELIQPVDMFPQTYHIECVCLLSKV